MSKNLFFGTESIFTLSRLEKYFYGVDGLASYQAAAQYLSQNNCQNIGLMINDIHLEYLFWKILAVENSQMPRLEHILVNNPSGPLGASGPICAIARFGEPLTQPLSYQGQQFSQHWQHNTTTLSPEQQIHLYTVPN